MAERGDTSGMVPQRSRPGRLLILCCDGMPRSMATRSAAPNVPVEARGFVRVACNRLLAGFRHTVEKINASSLQRVFGTYDEESISLDQLFEDLRPVSEMVCGDADIGPNGVPH